MFLKQSASALFLGILLTACGQTSGPASDEATQASAQPIQAEGWVEIVPGGYRRTTDTGVEHWATSNDGVRWLLAENQKALAVDSTYLQADVTALEARKQQINFLSHYVELLNKADSSRLSAQAGSCSIQATASPLSAGSGTKANAYANCTAPNQMSSSAVAQANGLQNTMSDYQPGNRYYSSASTQIGGTTGCYSYASVGVVGVGSRDSTNYRCK